VAAAGKVEFLIEVGKFGGILMWFGGRLNADLSIKSHIDDVRSSSKSFHDLL